MHSTSFRFFNTECFRSKKLKAIRSSIRDCSDENAMYNHAKYKSNLSVLIVCKNILQKHSCNVQKHAWQWSFCMDILELIISIHGNHTHAIYVPLQTKQRKLNSPYESCFPKTSLYVTEDVLWTSLEPYGRVIPFRSMHFIYSWRFWIFCGQPPHVNRWDVISCTCHNPIPTVTFLKYIFKKFNLSWDVCFLRDATTTRSW